MKPPHRPDPVFSRRCGLACAAWFSLGALTASAWAQDWPQWRGPSRDGISAETNWSAKGAEAPRWTRAVGLGYSSVVVAGGRLYTAGWDEGKEHDVIWCLDARSGEELWTHSYPAEKWAKYHGGGTNCTPSIEGDRLYVLNREGRLTCFNAESGGVHWAKNMVADHGASIPTWGFAASPLVLDDMLVINVGSVFALDKASGEVKWKSRDLGHAYSTPVDATFDGRACLVVFNGGGVAVLDRADGNVLATHEWKTSYDVNAATPIVIGDRIFISSGYNHGCAMFRFDGESLSMLWESKVMRTQMSGCVYLGGHLYGFDDAVLKCIDLEGNEKWRERGLGQGAVSSAGGRIIAIGGKGDLVVVEADPTAYREHSRAKVLDGGVCWTMPVLVDGLIYCRNSLGTLVCRDHRGE